MHLNTIWRTAPYPFYREYDLLPVKGADIATLKAMADYLTLQKRARAEFTVNKSRFIGTAAPVCSNEEALAFVNEIRKEFRGKKLSIKVTNPAHKESGVKELLLNGAALNGDYIPADLLKDENEILITLG